MLERIREAPDIEHIVLSEDELAAYTLHKTICFLIYSLLVIVFSMGAGVMVATHFPVLQTDEVTIAYGVMLPVEAILLYLIIRGYLPGTRDSFIQPFSEKQIGTACNVLGALTWVFAGVTNEGKIMRMIINGALVICIGVYFVTKSVLSKKIRWQVLWVEGVPGSELAFELLSMS